MKRFRHITREDCLVPDEPVLDLSSLIDVCFLLLIYFLVTTTIQPREQDLRTRIPVESNVPVITFPPMVIELRQGGEVVMNPGDAAEVYEVDVSERELPELERRLQSMVGFVGSGMPKVLLRVHDEVVQQRYIDVVNCLAAVGIREIALVD